MSHDQTGELANIRVLVEIDGPVATLTLNRPDKRNAINMGMWASIDAQVSALQQIQMFEFLLCAVAVITSVRVPTLRN